MVDSMQGSPSFFGIASCDQIKARRFFGMLLGWKIPAFDPANLTRVDTQTLSGFMHDSDQLRRVTVYFGVDDIEAACARVISLGGKVQSITPDIAGFGRFANCLDDQGMEFHLHQPPTNQTPALSG
jgi:predicted enzyme related to lactoylglutathione lyase